VDETDFSQGPWTVEHELDRDGLHLFWINTVHKSTVAKCYNPDNANFIASAPDIYEALKLLKDAIDDAEINSSVKDINNALYFTEIALAKAEGCTPND
jgi:hypothetical protein